MSVIESAARGMPTSPALPRFGLETRGLPPREALDLWQATVDPVFDFTLGAGTEPQAFAVSFEAFHFGSMIAARTAGSGSYGFERTAEKVARSGIDHFLVQAFIRGRKQIVDDDGEAEVGPGDVWIFDMARTVRTRTQDYINLSLIIPRAALVPLLVEPDRLHGSKLGHETLLGSLLHDHIRSLDLRAPQMTIREAAAITASTLHLIAGCAGPIAERREAAASEAASAVLARLRRSIEDHLGDPDLGPDLLTRRHGLSRARLYRLFEPIGGVADYIRHRRLARCLRDLRAAALREVRIVDIARTWGFANEAAFVRAFRARYGATPGEIRRGRAIDPAVAGDGGHDPSGPPSARWVWTLMER